MPHILYGPVLRHPLFSGGAWSSRCVSCGEPSATAAVPLLSTWVCRWLLFLSGCCWSELTRVLFSSLSVNISCSRSLWPCVLWIETHVGAYGCHAARHWAEHNKLVIETQTGLALARFYNCRDCILPQVRNNDLVISPSIYTFIPWLGLYLTIAVSVSATFPFLLSFHFHYRKYAPCIYLYGHRCTN